MPAQEEEEITDTMEFPTPPPDKVLMIVTSETGSYVGVTIEREMLEGYPELVVGEVMKKVNAELERMDVARSSGSDDAQPAASS